MNGILGRVPALGALLDHARLLEAAGDIVGGPFRLSSFHSRSLKPGAAEERLHQDVATGAEAWPLAGFILMLDPFTAQNGATRFVPGHATSRSFPTSIRRK
jgi:ectoine hydroxylase-related dioxygenase (phytanoyl-CoA dioxygenase family)